MRSPNSTQTHPPPSLLHTPPPAPPPLFWETPTRIFSTRSHPLVGGGGSRGIVGVSQTCLGANVLSGLVPSTVFKKNLWAFLGPCVRGRGRPWYGTSAQPESHFTCSSPKGAPWVVPSASLLNYFWAFLGPWGRARGRPWYGTFAKPRSHFTEGMFEKRWNWGSAQGPFTVKKKAPLGWKRLQWGRGGMEMKGRWGLALCLAHFSWFQEPF